MSENTKSARRASLAVSIDGHDATGWLDPSLIDLTYTDQASGKADEVQLTLHDRDGSWRNDWMPRKGMAVSARIVCHDWFAEGEDYELPCGQFRIDEVEYKGPPATVAIKAVSASLTGGLRDEAKTRGWEYKGLKALAGEIAWQHDLKLVWEGTDVTLGRVDQRNESDLAFIDRLATDRGMLCKVHDGKLAIYSRDGAEGQKADITVKPAAFDGEPMTTLVPQSWSFKEKSSGTGYNGARVSYTNPVTGKVSMVQLRRKDGTNAYGLTPPQGHDKTLTSQQRAESPQDAVALAHGQLQRKNQNEATCTLDFMGDPRLVAGKVVRMEGFGKFSGPYLVKKATHKVSAREGYTTSLDLTRCGPGKDAWAVTATDEALAKPARPAPRNTVEAAVNEAVNDVANWEAGLDYLNSYIDMGPVDETDDIIRCIPLIASAQSGRAASRNVDDGIGWSYLSEMATRWLAGSYRPPLQVRSDVPFWVDFDWVMRYPRAKQEFEEFLVRDDASSRVWSQAARDTLGCILQRNDKLTYKKEFFDFINDGCSLWEDRHHSSRIVGRIPFGTDGLAAALSKFTFRVLAAGYTEPIEIGVRYNIVVTKLAVFVHDTFNFDHEPYAYDSYLAYWSCQNKDFAILLTGGDDDYRILHNLDFQNFREKYRHGLDFDVFSLPHELANYQVAPYEYTCSTNPKCWPEK